jgi:hypothetical protein
MRRRKEGSQVSPYISVSQQRKCNSCNFLTDRDEETRRKENVEEEREEVGLRETRERERRGGRWKEKNEGEGHTGIKGSRGRGRK